MTWSFVNKGGALYAHPTTAVPVPASIAADDWRFAIYAGKSTEASTITSAGGSYADIEELGSTKFLWNGTTGWFHLYAFLNNETTTQIGLSQSGALDSNNAEEYAFRHSGDPVSVRVREFGFEDDSTDFFRPPAVTVGDDSLVLSIVAITNDFSFSLASAEGFTLRGQDAEFGGTDMAFAVASKFVTAGEEVTMPNWQSSTPILWAYATIVVGAAIPRTPGEPLEAVSPIIEMAFGDSPFEASPTWVDVSEYVTGLSLRRGRSSLLRQFDAGTGVIRMENVDGRFDPNNTSSPYSPDVTLRCPVRITVDHNAVDYVVFRGLVEAWPTDYPPGGFDAVSNVPIVDFTKPLAGFQLDGFVLDGADTVGERITAILDEVGFPAALRDVDNGLAQRPTITYTGSALDAIRSEVDADGGSFFIAADGTATFRTRVHYAGGQLSNATFGQADSEIGYEAIRVSYDDDDLYNSVAASFDGAGVDSSDSSMSDVPRVKKDATSIASVGEYRLPLSASFASDNEADNLAEWNVLKYKDVKTRIRGLTLFPQFDEDNSYPQVLGRELRDAVVVKFQPPGGGDPLEQQVTVESIAHDVTPLTWVTTWELHPLADVETNDFWIVGTSELGTDTRLA